MSIETLDARVGEVRKIIFISNAHEKFYYEKLKEARCKDVYYKVLCYCFGIILEQQIGVRLIYCKEENRWVLVYR